MSAPSGYDTKELGHEKEMLGIQEAGQKMGLNESYWMSNWARNQRGISAISEREK